jgi:hypothetical protein
MKRIVRVPVFHRSVYRDLVGAAVRAAGSMRHGDQYWEPIEKGRRFHLYRPAAHNLAWIQNRVEEYELSFYRQLAGGCCGRDDIVRPRTHLLRASDGTYRTGHKADRFNVAGWEA